VFQVQFGSSGENLRVECGGVAVPGITGVTWTFLGHQLSSQHHKYQILTSAEQNYGFRSTLLVRQSGEILNHTLNMEVDLQSLVGLHVT
jgi:hypothetical protein